MSLTEQAAAAEDLSNLPLDQIDVSDPKLYQEDSFHPLFARLRAEDPVHFCPDSAFGPYWSITKYDDVWNVELDPKTFSSSSEVGGVQIRDQPSGQEAINFIRMDPPEHTAQRKIVSPIVAPSNITNFEPLVRRRTEAILDELPRNETFDWVDRVSAELTGMMLCTLFDTPIADRRRLLHWSDVSISPVGLPDSPVKTEIERMDELANMAHYFKPFWNDRIASPPKSDLISMLAHGAATQNMDARAFIGTIGLLIVAGNDTTQNSMSAGVLALDENPAEAKKLRDNPGLIPNFVAESIRYHSPVIHMRRTATTDVVIGGKTITKGSKVVMWYVSANYDSDKIPEANRFLIDRDKPRQHLAFGAGVHRCVGDRLAELQLRILWEEILKRDLKISVVGKPKRLFSNFIRGIRSLPVQIH